MKKCIVCENNDRQKHSASCCDCHGESFVSTLHTIGDTDLVLDFPSVEHGSSCLAVASIHDLKESDCFDGDNNIVIYDTEHQSIFAENLKQFFSEGIIEIDGFTSEQNKKVVKEIHALLDSGLSELDSVFFDTVAQNIDRAYQS